MLNLRCILRKVSTNVSNLTPKDLKTSRTQFVSELELRLLTSSHELWNEPATNSNIKSEPFWSIFWPGGQVLTRFILDSKIVENQRVLGMVSNKMSLVTIFDHNHLSKNFFNKFDILKLQGVRKWNVFFEIIPVAKLLDILAGSDAF